MAVRVFVPALLRPLCRGAAVVEVPPGTLGEIVAALDERCPGLASRISDGGALRPDLAVALNGETASLAFHEVIPDGAEIAFLPALSGG